MTTALLIIHLFVTLALIAVVLIQRSEGGGLGVGTSQGMGSFMSGRGTANLLTRTTAILAALFFALSLALALLNRGTTVGPGSSILDVPPPPRTTPADGTPASKPSALVPPVTPAPAPPAAAAPTPPVATAPASPAPAPAPESPAAPGQPAPTPPSAPPGDTH